MMMMESSKSSLSFTKIDLTSRKSRSKTKSLNAPRARSRPPSSSGSDSEYMDFILDAPVKSRFTSGNFLKASQIIRSINNVQNQEERRPIFWSDEERILTYELTVAILKHSSFLRDALEKSNFYLKHPHLRSTSQEELLVVLYDLIEREFRVSPEDSPLPPLFADMQSAVLESKTKLMAHIAKLRIKHEATSLENLLPTNLRQRQNIDKNPLYVWVNLRKVQEIKKVVAVLRSQGLQETRYEDDTLIQENLFCISQLHPDLIRMNSSKTNVVTSMPIFRDGYIVVQDKSACLPAYALIKAIYFKEAIHHRGAGMEFLNPFPTGDFMDKEVQDSTGEEWYHGILDGSGKNGGTKTESIVVTHCGLGRSAAHLAILLSEAVPRYLSKSINMTTTGSDLAKAMKSKFVYRPPLQVIVFGTPQNKFDEIYKYIKKTLGITNIRLYSDDFLNVTKKDPRIKGCGAILVNPPSSGSALKDPVAYICSEGGDEKILEQYSQFVSSTTATIKDPNGNAIVYSPNQTKYLMHAMNIPNVKLVLYTTCSNLPCENSEVVRACLNEARRKEEARKCQLYASIVMQSQSKLFREIKFELVNLETIMKGYESESCFKDSFVDMQPSSACSGVFMALIRRRDQFINMAKNPVKQFVASQIKVWSEAGDDEELEELLSYQTSGHASSTNLGFSLTEQDLAQYMIRKLNLDENELKLKTAEEAENSPSSSIPIFKAHFKKKASKKAIVKRVSTPTHSSLQRQTEKFYKNLNTYSSNPPSGTTTPRSGARTPVSAISSGMGDTRSTTAGSKPSTPRSTTASGTACPHHHHHGHVCVCARHAKKFPDMVKNL